MNKENNKGAAGLRRSAIAERIRLREEWSALKGTDDVQKPANVRDKRRNVLRNATDHVRADNKRNIVTGSKLRPKTGMDNSRFARAMTATTEVLRGVVALVDVGAESRALPLRAALTALGATVAPTFSPLVTHLIWSQGGCRDTRARARALACQLVSPLWVEACASGGRRLPEIAFPAAARPSDLPSPRTLRRLLYKAEMENVPLADLLADGREKEAETKPLLRMSSETERDTSTTDTSANTSHDTSHDKSNDRSHDKTDIEARVNTAPRRVLPSTSVSTHPAKSRRKLFTQKEPDLSKSIPNESDEDRTPVRPKMLTQREKRDLAHAERMARKIINAGTRTNIPTQRHANAPADMRAYKIVLTGMSRSERVAAYNAIRTLNGRIQKEVNRKTTHVLLGSCREDSPDRSREKTSNKTSTSNNITNKSNSSIRITINKSINNKNVTNEETEVQKSNMAALETLASKLNVRSPSEKRKLTMTSTPKKKNKIDTTTSTNNLIELSGVSTIQKTRDESNMASALAGKSNMAAEVTAVKNKMASRKERTLNALLGAARGCRVLFGNWAISCVEEGRWIHHCGYEVPHLRKLSQRARIERNALGKTRSEYAYDVFNGMRVRVSTDADQRDAAIQLLKLCGAIIVHDNQEKGKTQHEISQNKCGIEDCTSKEHDKIQDGDKENCTTQHNTVRHVKQNGGWTQNGGSCQNCVITIGIEDGQVNSKWVFDSVASARIRTVRRYINESVQETTTFCE